MKLSTLILFLLFAGMNAQNKDTDNFFESRISRKINNVLSFIDISHTINLNDYNKSIIYALVTPINERYFTVSLQNQLPDMDKKQCKCFQINDNRFVVFIDRSDENFGQTELYKKNFRINTNNAVLCDSLFKRLKANKPSKIPENVFAYSIFEETFIYLEDLATFDALQYLEIEYDLNKSR